jgi:thiosulfate dehydrogenase
MGGSEPAAALEMSGRRRRGQTIRSSRGRLNMLVTAMALLAIFASARQRAMAQVGEIETQRPWAFTRDIDRSTGTVRYMATTAAIDQSDFWLLLACHQDGRSTISFMHLGGFPYLLGSPTHVSLRVDSNRAITIVAPQMENRQISIEPVSSGHLLRSVIQGRRLSVTVVDAGGGSHDYKLLLQPNDLALRDIRINCLDPFSTIRARERAIGRARGRKVCRAGGASSPEDAKNRNVTMGATRHVFFVALMSAAVAALSLSDALGASSTVDLTTWTPPDIGTVADDAFGKLVKYGYALVTDTAREIGPAAADPAKRYAGNNLTCQSCHLQAGTQPYAVPLVGVWGQFPQYRAREGEVGTLEDRLNGCMVRSLNGRALALDGREMKGLLAYAKWLSTGIPDGAKLIGAGTLPVKEPGRAADLRHGAQVYAQTCAACHGPDGQGQRAEGAAGYQFPPLWGPDSYNNGAGMTRLLTAAAFARHNMPLGTTFASPTLSDEEAYDVAGYINSQARPQKANLDRDFPNRLQKPVDAPYGPYADGFSAEQHKYGPYAPIRAKLKELAGKSQ